MPAKHSLLLMALALLQWPTAAARAEGFGRWESPLRHCQLLWARDGDRPAQSSTCLALRLDQTIEGLLRIRFINATTGSRFASEELTFVGLLRKQDLPMRCTQGSCEPQWPMRVELQGITALRFDSRGLAEHLPRVHLGRGSCLLEPPHLLCDAQAERGQSWRARAELPVAASPAKNPVQGR